MNTTTMNQAAVAAAPATALDAKAYGALYEICRTSLAVFRVDDEWRASYMSGFRFHPGTPACPCCGGHHVDLVNSDTPAYHLKCFDCGAQSARYFSPSWRGLEIKGSQHECAIFHMEAMAIALASWDPKDRGESLSN